MEEINMNNETVPDGIGQRAVSLYGQNEGVDDFPVLKAFQQYIDAEQEKARKRILWLGIFFGSVLIVVITVFMILLHGINMRNQALSDRLVEYAMQQVDRHQRTQPVTTTAAAPQNDAALKAMTDALAAIQKNIEASNKNTASVQSDKTINDLSAQKESLRLERVKNQLEVERKLLADERERLHQIEVDRQRRKLYPELYDGGATTRDAPSRSRTLTDEDIREIIREAYPEASVREESKEKSTPPKSARKKSEEIDLEEDDAVEYFKDDDYTIPVDVKGTDSKMRFTVPVD